VAFSHSPLMGSRWGLGRPILPRLPGLAGTVRAEGNQDGISISREKTIKLRWGVTLDSVAFKYNSCNKKLLYSPLGVVRTSMSEPPQIYLYVFIQILLSKHPKKGCFIVTKKWQNILTLTYYCATICPICQTLVVYG
jgi:hypothetical protein